MFHFDYIGSLLGIKTASAVTCAQSSLPSLSETGKLQCILTDPARRQEVDILPAGRFSNLNQENQDAVAVMLSLSHRLAKAHFLKEKFLSFADSPSFEEAKQRLTEWYMHVASCHLPEFNRCVETIVAWQDEVLTSFKVPYTNGYTCSGEGYCT